jgi:death-on-curing protein
MPGRDEAALEAALARARQGHAFEPDPDVARLAAAYGFGVVGDHPFNDGNKLVGFLAIGLFLSLNGYELLADPVEAVGVIMALAAGRPKELELAGWIRQNVSRRKS